MSASDTTSGGGEPVASRTRSRSRSNERDSSGHAFLDASQLQWQAFEKQKAKSVGNSEEQEDKSVNVGNSGKPVLQVSEDVESLSGSRAEGPDADISGGSGNTLMDRLTHFPTTDVVVARLVQFATKLAMRGTPLSLLEFHTFYPAVLLCQHLAIDESSRELVALVDFVFQLGIGDPGSSPSSPASSPLRPSSPLPGFDARGQQNVGGDARGQQNVSGNFYGVNKWDISPLETHVKKLDTNLRYTPRGVVAFSQFRNGWVNYAHERKRTTRDLPAVKLRDFLNGVERSRLDRLLAQNPGLKVSEALDAISDPFLPENCQSSEDELNKRWQTLSQGKSTPEMYAERILTLAVQFTSAGFASPSALRVQTAFSQGLNSAQTRSWAQFYFKTLLPDASREYSHERALTGCAAYLRSLMLDANDSSGSSKSGKNDGKHSPKKPDPRKSGSRQSGKSQGSFLDLICYNCEKKGHKSADCRSPKRQTNDSERKKKPPRGTKPKPSSDVPSSSAGAPAPNETGSAAAGDSAMTDGFYEKLMDLIESQGRSFAADGALEAEHDSVTVSSASSNSRPVAVVPENAPTGCLDASFRSSVFEVSLGKLGVSARALFDTGGFQTLSHMSESCYKRLVKSGALVFALPNSGNSTKGQGGTPFYPLRTVSTDLILEGVDHKRPHIRRVAKLHLEFDVVEDSLMFYDLHICEGDLSKHGMWLKSRKLFFPETKPITLGTVDEEIQNGKVWDLLISSAKKQPAENLKRLKDASRVSELSETTLLALKAKGRVPLDTAAGILVVGEQASPRNKKRLTDLVNKYANVFSKKGKLGINGMELANIELQPNYVPKLVKFRQKNNPILKDVLLDKIARGVLQYWSKKVRSTSRYFLVHKGGYPRDDIRAWRLVTDVSCNPGVVNVDTEPLPKPLELAQELCAFKYFYETDLRDAYHQVLLNELSKELVCLSTPIGITTFRGLVPGIRGAQSQLLRALGKVFSSMQELKIYADNLFAGFNDEDRCVESFEKLLRICEARNVYLNIADTVVLSKTAEPLGFVIGNGCYSPSARLTASIERMPKPSTAKELKSFLALSNVFRNFVDGYGAKTAPLLQLLKSPNFEWKEKHSVAFDSIRSCFIAPPVLQKFDKELKTRLVIDTNDNDDKPATASALLQHHVTTGKWLPCGFASRFLTVPEVRLCRRDVANSSSYLEGVGFAFGLQFFYPELSQLSRFEVLCDARNLIYWKTSPSMLMVRLRSKIATMYDTDCITLRHVKRGATTMVDALARLAPSPAAGEFEEGVSLSSAGAQSDLSHDQMVPQQSAGDCSLAGDYSLACDYSLALGNLDPWDEGFELADFTDEERKKFSRSVILSPRVSIVKKGRRLFLVPDGQIESLLKKKHIDGAGAHVTKKDFKEKLRDFVVPASKIDFFVKSCSVCQGRQKNPREGPGSDARFPKRYGEEAGWDTAGPYKTREESGDRYVSFMVDYYSNTVSAKTLPKLRAEDLLSAWTYHTSNGIVPMTVLMDRHKTYMGQDIRQALTAEKAEVRYSKGSDHRFQLAETVVKAFGLWRQSLPDPLDWASKLDFFVKAYNQTKKGSVSSAELAYSVVLDPRRTLLELRSGVRAASGARDKMPLVFNAGDRALLARKPMHRGERAFVEVEVIEQQGARTMIQNAGDIVYVPTRNLTALGKEPSAHIDSLGYSKMELDADAKAPVQEGNWTLYRDGSKAHVGVAVQSQKANQILLHAFEADRKNPARFVPMWTRDADGELVTAESKPRLCSAAVYVVDGVNVIASFPREDGYFTPPIGLLREMATFNREK